MLSMHSRLFSIFFIPSLAFALLVLGFGFVSAQTGATACLKFPSTSAPPTGYAVSWDVFDFAKPLLVKTNCPNSGTSLTMTVGKGDATQYVWGTPHIYTGTAWRAQTLSGTDGGSGWLTGSGTKNITTPFAPTTANPMYFVGYVCANISSTWKCGCENQTCPTSKWQLQAYSGLTSPGGIDPGAGGNGGGTGGGGAVDLSKSACFSKPANKISVLNGPNPASFNAVSGQTYDARGQTFTESTLDGSAGVLHPQGGSDFCIVGPKIVGPVTSDKPWLSAMKPDGIQHGNSTGPYVVHGAWLSGVNDALSPPKSGDTSRGVTFSYRDIYVKQAHDDLLENDACLAGEIKDSLIDGIHMGFSSRPGGAVSINTPRTTVRIQDTMVRLICQTDTRSKAPSVGCSGMSSQAEWFKDGPDCHFTNGNDVKYELTNVILRADADAVSGGIGSMYIPADAVINNVTVIYLGPNPSKLPNLPAGVRVITDKATGEQVWNTARNQWLTRHGCDSTGNNCAYLRK